MGYALPMNRAVVCAIAPLLLLLLAGSCRRDPTEEELAERSRIAASYEAVIRDRESEWVHTVGKSMATVLALRVRPEAHDTARTALAIIIDDILEPDGEDGIKALEVLLQADRTTRERPELYVAAWVEKGHLHRRLRGPAPESVIANLHVRELTFDVAGSDERRRITMRLYYATDALERRLAELRQQAGLPPGGP